MYTPTCFYDSSLIPRLHLTYVHMSACLLILHINLCEHPHRLLLSVYTNWNLDSLSTTRTGRRSEILQIILTLKRAHPPIWLDLIQIHQSGFLMSLEGWTNGGQTLQHEIILTHHQSSLFNRLGLHCAQIYKLCCLFADAPISKEGEQFCRVAVSSSKCWMWEMNAISLAN